MYRKPYAFLLFAIVLFVSLSVFGCGRQKLEEKLDQTQRELDQCRERVAALNDTTMALRENLMGIQENITASAAERDSLQQELQAYEDSLRTSELRMNELREDLAAQERKTTAAQESARRQTVQRQPAQRQPIVRSDIARDRALLMERNAEIDSLMRVREALEDSLASCEERVADMMAVQDSLRTAMTDGVGTRDNRVRTLSVLLVVAAAAFVVSLVWGIVKK